MLGSTQESAHNVRWPRRVPLACFPLALSARRGQVRCLQASRVVNRVRFAAHEGYLVVRLGMAVKAAVDLPDLWIRPVTAVTVEAPTVALVARWD